MTTRFVILPGLDGSSELLEPFIELAPPGCSATVIGLPDDSTANYESLPAVLASQIERFAPCHLIAESYSGPLGIRIASRYPELVSRLTLAATFATPPAPGVVRLLPWSLLFRLPLPRWAAQVFLTGADRKVAERLCIAVRRTSSATLAKRLRCVLTVDVRSELQSLACPVQYLRATRDLVVPVRALRRIREVNPRVQVREIEGPHLILQVRPEAAWTAIMRGAGE
ncbi:MAG: alpha/beta hydrolase [Pirellulales bacterium]